MILGFVGAVLMGLALGLIGGGGSILTVPILVYLFGVDAVTATAYSLFIVGLTSLIGSLSHMKLGNVQWRTAVVFGIPSIISVFLTRALLVPSLPEVLFSVGGFQVTKAVGLLALFALLMILAAVSMIRPGTAPAELLAENSESGPTTVSWQVLLEGAVVGVITGLVGAGGGFLIIPALIHFAKLPMKQAVGTSLIIIAAKSLIGFGGDLRGSEVINWTFLLQFTGVAVVGILAGAALSHRIPNEKLKPAFGWFVLVMGIFVLVRELSGLR